MPRKPECGCKDHANFASGKEFSLFKRSSRKYPKQVDDILIEKGILSDRATYLCNACADYAYENFVLPPKEKRVKHSNHYVETIMEFITSGEIEDADLIRIVKCIGEKKRPDLYSDVRSQSSDYRNDEFINSYDPCTWLQCQNQVVLEFLKSLCGIDTLTENRKKTLSLVKLFEQLLLCCYENAILPLSFITNLISYFSTGSKTVSEIQKALSPCGSYNTILNWVNVRSEKANVLPADNDVITFFDNNQVLARNWRVTYDYKSTASVITNILHLFPNTVTQIQFLPELSPSSWLYNRTRVENAACIRALVDESEEIFRTFRHNFISSRLSVILKEDDFSDEPPAKMQTNFNKSEDKYSFVSSSSAKKPSLVALGDPLMENPCSYKAVKNILQSINKTCCETREWSCGLRWFAIYISISFDGQIFYMCCL